MQKKIDLPQKCQQKINDENVLVNFMILFRQKMVKNLTEHVTEMEKSVIEANTQMDKFVRYSFWFF